MVNKIVSKIEEFIKNAIIFTAFDVTKALRAEGNFVTHAEIKKVISSFDFDQHDYERSLAQSSVFDVKPYIYHSAEHTDGDIQRYEDETTASIKGIKVPTPVVVDIPDDTEDDDAVIDSIVLKVDSRQRCAISNRVILNTFNIGDKLGVWLDETNNVTVIEEVDPDWDYGAVLTVDKSGNIRVPLKLLPGTVLDVEYGDSVTNQIYLKAH